MLFHMDVYAARCDTHVWVSTHDNLLVDTVRDIIYGIAHFEDRTETMSKGRNNKNVICREAKPKFGRVNKSRVIPTIKCLL